jgi:hypothetical protein
VATYYAVLELLKEALSNGFALHFKIEETAEGRRSAEGLRVAVDIFTIMHVSDAEGTESEIDQL